MQFYKVKDNFTVLYTILVVHLADFGVNTHLLKREAILVGVAIFTFELHPFGVNSQYTCVGMVHTYVAFGCSNHFQVTPGLGFYSFPSLPHERRQC